MKFISFFVELIYWIQIFLCPTLLIGAIGLACYGYLKGPTGSLLFFAFIALGIGTGIYFAERVRRRIGCSTFMSRVMGRSSSDTPNN